MYFVQFEKEVGGKTKTKTQAFSADLNPDWNNVVVSSYTSDQKVLVSFDLDTEEETFDKVHSAFTYDASTDKVYIYAWLERSGRIQTLNDIALGNCSVNIYNSSGTVIKTLNVVVPANSGIYSAHWDVSSGVNRQSSYLGVATIEVGGTTYTTSGVFNLSASYHEQLESTFRA